MTIKKAKNYVTTIVAAVARRARLLNVTVFILGLGLFLILNAGLILQVLQGRSAPIEVDDSYTAICKAVQMATCFRQDCPALENLRPQLSVPSQDPELAWLRYKEYTRAFLVYHPLQSALVAILHGVGLSWEKAHKAIGVIGVVFVAIAMAYWLATLFGPGPAGVALALLAFMDLQGEGLVPSDLALGLAMVVWARISARHGVAEWTLALGSLAMVAIHPIGRLYALASIALCVLLARKQVWKRRSLVAILFSISIVGLSFLLPLVVHHPEFAIRADPPLAGWPQTWFGILRLGIKKNWQDIDWTLTTWIELYGSFVWAALITALGFLSLPRPQRSTALKNFLVLLGLLIISVGYVLPRYPADLFERIWVGMVILLTGATAQVAWIIVAKTRYFKELISGLRKRASLFCRWMLSKTRSYSSRRALASEPVNPGWVLAASASLSDASSGRPVILNWVLGLILALGLGILVVIRVQTGIAKGLESREDALVSMRDEQVWALDPAQPKLMLDQARASDTVLYIDEVPMHFYFTHGAMKNKAIFYPALADPSQAIILDPDRELDSPRMYKAVNADDLTQPEWAKSETLRYFVSWSPVEQLSKTEEARIPISVFSGIEYSSPVQVALDKIRIYLLNLGKESALQVMYTSNETTKTITISVPAGWSGWLSSPADTPHVTLKTFSFKAGADAKVYLKGIRFDDTKLNWPWDQRASLVFHLNKSKDAPSEDESENGESENAKSNSEDTRKKETVTIRFDPDELFPIRGLPVSVKVLNDSGSTVLTELVRTASR